MNRASKDKLRAPADTGRTGKALRAAAEIGASFLPGVGDAMAARDAVKEAKAGNYGKAALAAASALPVVGAVGDAARAADKASDAVRAVSPKVAKSVEAYLKKYGRQASTAASEQARKYGYKSQPTKREISQKNHWDAVYGEIVKRSLNRGNR